MGKTNKEILFESCKQEPDRIYRQPSDVVRDRRWDNEQRSAILAAWMRIATAEEEFELVKQIAAAQKHLDPQSAAPAIF